MKKQRLTLVSRVKGYVVRLHSLVPFLLGGVAISKVNREILSRCLEDWLFLVEDLMLRLDLSEAARVTRMDNFCSSLLQCDFAEVLSFLDSVFLYLIGKDTCIESFKQIQCKSLAAVDVSGRLLSPINTAVYQFLNETDSERKAFLLRLIAQFLRFPRKLEFQDIGLESLALRDYEETENDLAAMEYEDAELLDSISSIIVEWFGDFHIDNLRPNHGPGSVSEGSLTLAEKFEVLSTDKLLRVVLNSGQASASSFKEFYPLEPRDGIVRRSRTIFVPKTATKLRTISMEPASLQYIQQGVMKELYRYIKDHPFMGVSIKLSDQTQNQVLALEGSKYHTYGTIDLSHASDSVSWDLVRRVFKSVPRLYKWLLVTRSKETLLPDGRVIALKKFAPMGSALCFPIQCILFCAIIEHASRKAWPRLKWAERPLYSVYGDDLVVPTAIYESVIDALSACGFTVNTRKSYGDGPFRESCGKDYYAGYDISALYYRTPFYRKVMSPAAFGSMCSSANNAVYHSLPLYRWHLIKRLLSARKRHGPYFGYSPEVSPYLYSSQPTNFHVKPRWNKDLQRLEGRFTVVLSRPRDGKIEDDRLAYFTRLVEMAWRSSTPSRLLDELPSPIAVHGSVEYFSSTVNPIIPFVKSNQLLTHDWV